MAETSKAARASLEEELPSTVPQSVSSQDLQRLVEEADLGGRRPGGLAAKLIFTVAVAWSLFQLWFASPLPFAFNFAILNDTQARAIHLAFAFFLVFLCYPAFTRSSRNRIPATDWALAIIAAFCAAYLVIFYRELASRPG
jgi:TRAP-type uncharacterized transport system fused permease subunit